MQSHSLIIENEIVRAGAGAGKTTRLTKKVIEVAEAWSEEHGEYPRIVITTFTRKATQELRERLIVEACKDGRSELIDYVSSKSKLFISTIHGVLGRFLKSYGYLGGIDPNFTIVSPNEAALMGKKILRDVLFQEPEENVSVLLANYKFSQLYEMANIFYEGFIQYDSFSFYKYNQFRAHYITTLKEFYELFHDFCLEFRGCFPQDHAWAKFFSKSEDSLTFWKKIISDELPIVSGALLVEEFPTLPRIAGKVVEPFKESLQSFRSFYKDRVEKAFNSSYFDVDLWEQYIEMAKLFEPIAINYSTEFISLKMESGKVEMRDLELISFYGLKREPEMARAFSSDWDYWLIDEFQDTSPLQVELLDELIGSKPKFIVGDPQQSIYLFRGARSEVFAYKEREVESQKGKISFLQRNWRSRPELLHFINDLFSGIGDQFLPMDPKIEVTDSKTGVAYFSITEPELSSNGNKHQNEDFAILQHIIGLMDNGARLEEICILARTNQVLSDLAMFLEDRGVPTHVHSASGFYERREILDALAILKMLVNPHDNKNLVLVLRSPWIHVSDAELVRWCESIEKGVSHWGHFRNQFADHNVVKYICGLFERVRESGFSQTLKSILIEIGLIDSSLLFDPTGRRESNIWKLLYLLRTEEELPGFNVLNFIDQSFKSLDSENTVEEGDAVAILEPNRVSLMTVHASKGLQFEHVLIPRMEKSRSPGGVSPLMVIDEADKKWSVSLNLEETMRPSLLGKKQLDVSNEREEKELERLLYVAVTRAKSSVFFSWCGNPGSKSWANHINLDLLEGWHETEHYSYYVNRGPFKSMSVSVGSERKVELRDKLISNFKEDLSEKRRSVSSLLREFSQEPVASKRYNLVTDIENQSQIKNLDPMSPLESIRKSSSGTIFHRALEILKFQKDFDFENYFSNWIEEEPERWIHAMEYLKSIDEFPYLDVLKYGQVEWGFQLESKQGLLEGQIDLWAQLPNGESDVIWLVDYKSGSPRYKDKGFEQLEIYAYALSEFRPDCTIQMALVFPFSKKTEVKEFSSKKLVEKKYNL
ncbi:MAG: UvrD-helicase domain-containing protein [Bdellovibrionales bacterium]|nr:UvrD-helicase domain-containing protein [Bdellovibrionales bacterium]